MRLFAALVPPPEALDHASAALSAMRATAPASVRWQPRENLHVTMAFYGEVPEAAAELLTRDLIAAAAETAPFCLRLRGAGAFDHRTLWLGVHDDGPGLAALAEAARAVGAGLGVRDDGRPRHRSHLTVARAKRREPGLADLVHVLAVYEGPAWRVDTVHLLSSRLGAGPGGGALHQVVAAIPLCG